MIDPVGNYVIVGRAVHFDSFDLGSESTDPSGLESLLGAWCQAFVASGIAWEDIVVFYDTATENRSSRPAVALRALGHPRSHVLHGGATSWLDGGRPLSSEESRRPPAAWPDPLPKSSSVIIGINEVAMSLGRGDVVLLDVRDHEEFDGTKQMQNNPRLGRIPGCQPLEWTSLLRSRADYPKSAGTPRFEGQVLHRFLDDEELGRRLAEAGAGDPDTRVILYCQRSHRASNTYLALEKLGYFNASVFAGSFREWSQRLDLPVEA